MEIWERIREQAVSLLRADTGNDCGMTIAVCHHRTATHLNRLQSASGSATWRSLTLLRSPKTSLVSHCDRVIQVQLPQGVVNRVARLADAAHRASPAVGRDNRLAVVGAHSLAEALVQDPQRHALAFQEE